MTGSPGPEQDTDLTDGLLDGEARGVPDADGAGEQAQTQGPLEDEELLEAVRAGDESSYGVLYQRHRSTALNVARMHTRNVQDAEDLVSEAFTKVLAVIRKGGGPQKFLRSYLVTTIGRLAVDHGVASTRVKPVGEHSELDGAEEFDDVVVRQCDAVAVASAYASLPERWQAVLWHTEVEGMKPRATAEVLGMTPNAVSALNKRAREGLQAAYLQAQVSAAATSQCPEIAADLGAFARGSLGSRARRQVQQHLDACPRCTAEYLQLQDTGVGMRTWLLPAMAALPLWGTESKVLAALMVSGGGSGTAAAAAAHGTPDATAATSATGAVASDPTATGGAATSSHGPSLFEGAVDGAPLSPEDSWADASSAGSGGNAGTMAAAVGAGVGLKVAVGAVAASAVVALVGVGFNTLVQDDGTNGSTTLGGLPFPAHDGPAEATEAAETTGASSDEASGTPSSDDSESAEPVRVGLEHSEALPGPVAPSTETAEATQSSAGMSAFRNGPGDTALARSTESQAAVPTRNNPGATSNIGLVPRSTDQQGPTTGQVPAAPREQTPANSGTTPVASPGTGHAGGTLPPPADDTPAPASTTPTPEQPGGVPTDPTTSDPGTGEEDGVPPTSEPTGTPTDGDDSSRNETPEAQLPTDEPGPQAQDLTETEEPAALSPSPVPTTDASAPTDGSTDSSGGDISTRDTTGGDPADPTDGSDTDGYWVFTPDGWVFVA